MMDHEDAQLMGRFLEADDSAAFGALVERHLGVVYRTALRLVGGDAHQAEDVAQAVFVLLARKAEALRGRGSVAGWLYEATRRIARDVRRSEERRKRREEGAAIMNELLGNGAGVDMSEAEARASWEMLRPVLDDALGELSAAEREVVLLRFFGGKAFGEIGAALRLSEDAARMRAGRALEKLRGLLERRGVKSTSAALGMALAGDAAMGAPAGLAITVSQGALAGAASLAGGAGATFGVGASFGAVGFMSAIKTVGVVSIVSAVTFFGVTEIAAKRDAEAALNGVKADHAMLAKMAEEAERVVKLAEQKAARRAEEKATAATVLARAEQENPKIDPVVLGDALMAKHPEVKAALIAQYRAGLVLKYLPFYRELKLTAEQRAQFEEIQLSNDVPGLSLDEGKISLRIPRRLRSAERNQRLKELLGEEGYQALSRFDQESGVRAQAAETAGLLFDGGVPVTREQGEALAGLFGREKGAPGMTMPQYWKKIRAEAGAFLSPEQLEVLSIKQLRAEAAWADQQAAKRSIGK
jgi:RNA polymerase sigma factor (sigma-70 family)